MKLKSLVFFAVIVAACCLRAGAQDPQPNAASAPKAGAPAAEAKSAIDPHAEAWMKRMSDYLAQAPFFSVQGEIWQDIQLGSGLRAQVDRTIDLQVRRPDRFHSEVQSARRNHALFYDGKTVTLVNRVQNFYGTIPAPAALDAAMDEAGRKFGIRLPLEDFVLSDPYHNAMRSVVSGHDLGQMKLLGVPCEHLVFSQGDVDWQIWIQTGAKPVPRKIVITYKDEAGCPQYTAILSRWDFDTKLPDFLFQFEPPSGAKKIDVAEIKEQHETHKTEGK